MEGHCENNSINRMQEHLQAICPVSGVPPYTEDVRGGVNRWQVRIVLLRTGPSGDENMPMPWSSTHVVKKDAKKEAARLCLEALRASGARPHDIHQVWQAVRVTGSGGGSGEEGGGPVGAAVAFPALTDDLLAAQAVVCTPVASGSGAGDVQLEDDPDGADDGPPAAAAAHQRCFCSEGYECWLCVQRTAEMPAPPQGSLPPDNLGALGEQYALQWLQRQPWVEPDSVKWLNEDGTQAPTRDLECVPIGPPGRRHVEVKTRWRRFRKAGATKAQRARLLDPEDDYMLLIVGFFENLLPSDGPASAPQVRVLPNLKWEDKELKCAWGRKPVSAAKRTERGQGRGAAQRRGGGEGRGGGVFARLGRRSAGVTGPPPQGKEEGTVLCWKADKRFGFIRPTDGSAEVFCRGTNIIDGSCLEAGTQVHFRRSHNKAKNKDYASEVVGGTTEPVIEDCVQNFVWSVSEQQASGQDRPGMEQPPALCEACRVELERTGSELCTCSDCAKPWVFEAGERRHFQKLAAQKARDGEDFTMPQRCKPCRVRKREGLPLMESDEAVLEGERLRVEQRRKRAREDQERERERRQKDREY